MYLAPTHPFMESPVAVETRWVFRFITHNYFLGRTGGRGLENKLLGGGKLKLWTREYRLGRWGVRERRDDAEVMGRSAGEGPQDRREFLAGGKFLVTLSGNENNYIKGR